ncbi:hypothetical protein EXS56_00195 [Candidatus Kaiserbacteria bacterium]|nr:hypothetical protein [Candidatus Kaiserbacteria bacterium]
MKSFLNIVFVCLGAIFFLILVVLGYLFVTDAFGVKTLLTNAPTTYSGAAGTTGGGTDKNPLLSASQEQALQAIGVDPAALPSVITPTMIACFETKLGAERALQIKNGDSPTAIDFLKAKGCL